MLDPLSQGRGLMRAIVVGVAAAVLLVALGAPPALASCCACRTCGGAAFCVDGVASAFDCATFCVDSGCSSTVFDSADSCDGGCDGAPDAPTATPSGTVLSTATATATMTGADTPTDTPTPLASDTPTISPTATPSGTPTVTPTVTVTGTPTLTPALGGLVRYYVQDRPVPGVDVALIGTGATSAMTDAGGAFGFATVDASAHTIKPSKQGDFKAAVTALDASYVLQKVAGLMSFNSDQSLACDVTGDGTVSALDATRILQFQAAILTRFHVADLCGSDWVFRPMPDAAQNQTLVQPQISSSVCQQGAISYSPFVPPAAGQNFVALLFGDCTGNWGMPPP